MRFQGTIALETERLLLHKLTLSDADDMYNHWASQEEVARYMSWPACVTIEEAEKRLAEWQIRYNDLEECYWGIFLKSTNRPIGTIYLQVENKHAEIGLISYCIGVDWWGNGFITEALKKVIEFGFEEIGYNLIISYHALSNEASGRVMQKARMKKDAVLRQRDKTHLGYEDCVYYSILKSEYDILIKT
jgi:ribosomal-protein-alanine N-acetyltransferase